jgi:hypothetical protein
MGHKWGEEEHVEVTGKKARGKETTKKAKCRWAYNFEMK